MRAPRHCNSDFRLYLHGLREFLPMTERQLAVLHQLLKLWNRYASTIVSAKERSSGEISKAHSSKLLGTHRKKKRKKVVDNQS